MARATRSRRARQGGELVDAARDILIENAAVAEQQRRPGTLRFRVVDASSVDANAGTAGRVDQRALVDRTRQLDEKMRAGRNAANLGAWQRCAQRRDHEITPLPVHGSRAPQMPIEISRIEKGGEGALLQRG